MLWKTQISGLIESQDMKGFLDGNYPKLDEFIIKTSTKSGGSAAKQVMNP